MPIEDVTQVLRGPRRLDVAREEGLLRIAAMRGGTASGTTETTQVVDPVAKPPHAEATKLPRERDRGAQPEAAEPGERAKLVELVEALEKRMSDGTSFAVSFEISQDEPPVLLVRDRDTGDVIRTIPAEKVQEMTVAVDDMRGLLVNHTT